MTKILCGYLWNVLFLRFVPAGQVMAAQIKEQAERLLEELFPPKDISLQLEGMEEEVPHVAYGELPKETEGFSEDTEKVSGQSADQAGFAIYVDSDSFEMTEEEDSDIIRGKRIVYTREDAVRDNADKVEILAIKGLADIGEKEIGDVCVISVAYQEPEITDAYRYLTIEFIKEEAGWKIRFYGIEG